jgi:CDP-diacylglycerol--glycerol-3-phosphate 3-phosphatidyltransferase
MRINLPNQITLGRFVLTVAFLILLASFEFKHREQQLWRLDAAFVLFVLAAGTDWLDGYLARRQNQVTSFGRVLDPFVDKLLLVGALVLLLGQGFRDQDGLDVTGLQAWMVVLVISRELLVSGLRGFSESQGRPYAANLWGKAKMVLQSVTVGWLLLSVGRLRHVDWVMIGRPILIWAMVLFTAVSVGAYLVTSRDVLADRSRG